jgi:hypothetical protein
MDATNLAEQPRRAGRTGLSYKFQRLRERLRQAIASGELAGKLPGERALAKQFNVNAKTLSKALTDLAAEGLLDRSIGRGTYVKGSAPSTAGNDRRWLVVCDPDQVGWETVQLIRAAHPAMEIVTDVSSLRPSFLNGFSAVIDLAASTPEAFVRDLVVRNLPVVVVGKEPKTFSTHAVLFDGALAVNQVGRDLLLSGHRRVAAVEPKGTTVVASNLRSAAARYAPDATVDACFPQDVPAMVAMGITAFVCQSVDWAQQVSDQLLRLGRKVPADVSLVAIGTTSDVQAFSGYFIHRSEKVNAIVSLLNDTQAYRPTTLWMAGRHIDRGTTGPARAVPASAHTHVSSVQGPSAVAI